MIYKNILDKHIEQNTLSNNFILYGESLFLIDRYIKILSNIEDASILNVNQDEYNFDSAKAHLSQASLFGGRNILILKTHKKVPKKELEALVSYCEKNDDNLLIYAYTGENIRDYNDKRFFAKLSTMIVRFFHPKLPEAINIIAQVAQEKNVNIDRHCISHILNIHNLDVALSANEIDKFIIFDRAITIKDIDSLVFGLAEINIDDLVKKLILKKDFKEDIKSILERGEDEIRVITAITNFITQLYMFNIYIRVNGAPNAIEILGYPAPPPIVKEKAELSYKFKPNDYFKLHQLLLDAELQLKSSGIDKGAILLSTLLRFQQLSKRP